MSDLRELYRDVILDHNRSPHNFRPLTGASHTADGHNPLCGDRLTVYLDVEGDTVRDATFEGSGCAISTASASLMTDAVHGRPVEEVEALFARFREAVVGDEPPSADEVEELDKLAALIGVRDYPVRVKCATLAWHTLISALSGERVATTEEEGS